MSDYKGKDRRKLSEKDMTFIKEAVKEAFKEIGLDGDDAGQDIKELRGWMKNLRLIKNTARQTTVRILTTSFWLLLLGGLITWIKSHSS